MIEEGKPAHRKEARKSTLQLGPVTLAGEFKPRETRQEMETRLRIQEANAKQIRTERAERDAHERWRDRTILKVGFVTVAVIGGYCLVLNAWPGLPLESKAWATSTLTGIVGGLVGYIVGTTRKS